MYDGDAIRRLIDEINDMIENIEGDFPLLDFNSRYMMERGMRMSLMLIKALQKEWELSKPRWIPVMERLPENDTKVLAYYGFDQGDGYLGMMFMRVLDYYANDPVPHFQHEDTYGLTVTHWMPLPPAPEPPKEDET